MPHKKGDRSAQYDSQREGAAQRSRERSQAGREIGPLPQVAHPRRKARCKKSLRAFCETYFPGRFPWPFAECHVTAIERMEACAREGGLFAAAMPRGSGKTTVAECAVLWAVLYGLRRFVVLVQATEKLAAKSLKKIQRELETNALLLEDFPEVCWPIRALERNTQRARQQTLDGELTRMEWTADSVTLASVPGSASGGAILHVVGVTGAVRGLSTLGPGGEIVRPDMVLIDDAQTRDSAKSPTQTADREAVVTDDVLGLAGPGTAIAAVVLCTVIYPDDLSDRFLSPDRHPEWQGVRTRMLESYPERMDLWDEYAEVREESFRSGDRGRRANDFYAERREEMDRGARVSWPERQKKGELSGVQSAMNLYIDNPRGFKAEYQNEPDPVGGAGASRELHPDEVCSRLSGLPRMEVPREATRLVAMIDVGKSLHWYAVAAWDDRFGGSVLDYGCWPRQSRANFAADDPRPGLADVFPGVPETTAIYQGLEALVQEVLGRTYFREQTGEALKVERCLIDSGYQSQTVYQFWRACPHAGVIYPSKGFGRTNTARGVAGWKPRPGERSGHHWRLTMSEAGRGRMVQFDSDEWKTFLHERLTTPPGAPGHLTLFGRDAHAHEMLGEHFAAEYSDLAAVRGEQFDKWYQRPDRPDNHLWDCLVGCAVAASVQGLVWQASPSPGQQQPQHQRRKLSEVQRARQSQRGARGQ